MVSGRVRDSFFENDKDCCHVVAIGLNDLALLDDTVDDLVGVLFHLQLVVAASDVVGLS